MDVRRKFLFARYGLTLISQTKPCRRRSPRLSWSQLTRPVSPLSARGNLAPAESYKVHPRRRSIPDAPGVCVYSPSARRLLRGTATLRSSALPPTSLCLPRFLLRPARKAQGRSPLPPSTPSRRHSGPIASSAPSTSRRTPRLRSAARPTYTSRPAPTTSSPPPCRSPASTTCTPSCWASART